MQQEQIRKGLSREPSKSAGVPNPFENPEASPNRDEKNIEICEDTDLTADISRRTDRTSHSIPVDGSPVIIPTKKRGDLRDKGRESTLAVVGDGVPRPGSRSTSRDTTIATNTLRTPSRRRSRSLSKERLAHKAMEKLAGRPREVSSGKLERSSNTRSGSVNNEQLIEDVKSKRRRRSRGYEEEDVARWAESILLTMSQLPPRRDPGDHSLEGP